jgi:hypothetical protein
VPAAYGCLAPKIRSAQSIPFPLILCQESGDSAATNDSRTILPPLPMASCQWNDYFLPAHLRCQAASLLWVPGTLFGLSVCAAYGCLAPKIRSAQFTPFPLILCHGSGDSAATNHCRTILPLSPMASCQWNDYFLPAHLRCQAPYLCSLFAPLVGAWHQNSVGSIHSGSPGLCQRSGDSAATNDCRTFLPPSPLALCQWNGDFFGLFTLGARHLCWTTLLSAEG